jgi:hypothetical protein
MDCQASTYMMFLQYFHWTTLASSKGGCQAMAYMVSCNIFIAQQWHPLKVVVKLSLT